MSKITIDRAVVEQALEALFMYKPMVTGVTFQHGLGAMQALRAALEQPQVEQEPAAWIERWYGSGPERGWWIVCGRDHIAHLGPAEMSGEAASKIVSAHNTSPPAQRKPLTDEQIKRIDANTHFHESPDWSVRFARAIEAAHGITGEQA